ncbi:MAG: zinc-binding dehydrogenase [Frankiaceae bacterium]|nr:zinc-binding dehydrogenase [Frankiaceae bacterium]
MKAAAYLRTGGPEVLEYLDVPDPDPAPDGLIIEVRAIGIQGGDVLNRAGGAMTASPHVVGYQAAGVVAALGPAAPPAASGGFARGQRVVASAASGSHAELFAVGPSRTWAIPDGMSFETAASIPIEFGTADDCLFEFGGLRAGETVLVQAAAGGVGLAAVQLAKAAGARVLGTASSDERLARLGGYGLDVPINYAREDVIGAVLAATDGAGADLVVDSVGGPTLESSIGALAYRGRLSWVGNAGRATSPPQIGGLMGKNAALHGVYLGAELNLDGRGARGGRAHAMIQRLIERVGAGQLRAVIDSEFPLAEAAAAHRHIESRAAFGRVLLIP